MEKLLGIILLTLLFLMGGCVYKGYQHVDYLKANAETEWKRIGFEVVGYNGYVLGHGLIFTDYGSARVYHTLKKIPDNGITYNGFVMKWGNDIRVYPPEAVDAIRPSN